MQTQMSSVNGPLRSHYSSTDSGCLKLIIFAVLQMAVEEGPVLNQKVLICSKSKIMSPYYNGWLVTDRHTARGDCEDTVVVKYTFQYKFQTFPSPRTLF